VKLMAQPNSGPRGLLPDRLVLWADRGSLIVASDDPDCPFSAARYGAAANIVRAAPVRFGRQTS
jgi:hypothetical protein